MIEAAIMRSRELNLLLAWLGTALTGAVREYEEGDIDWPLLLNLAERHRVAAYLNQRMADEIRGQAPEPVVEHLRASSAATVGRALRQAALQRRLVQALESGGIAVIPIKGLVLSQQRYGAIGGRHVGDIDLLIRSENAQKGDALLQAAGLRRTRPDFALTPRQFRAYLAVKPEFEYLDPTTGQRVELVWRLDGIPEHHPAIWSHSDRCRIAGFDFRTLPPEIEALYLFQHGARHGWFRLFWLIDAALVLRDPAIDWTRVMARGREWQIDRAMLQGAALVHRLFGLPLPSALSAGAGDRRVLRGLEQEAIRQIQKPVSNHESAIEWSRQLAYRVQLQGSLHAKYATVAPHLFSPESWRTVRLPDRWFALYYPLTPFLWIWRRARRGG